ncbi:MAG: hypothetical protein M1823_000485 [Watsoniomyces obsoletus]|nr:MAG: hypothetical protein M1823_000485 [Watsoniomyces obsoletus]
MDGSSTNDQAPISGAEALRRKHEAEQAHHVTVEETIDEEDILHPPPSASRTSVDEGAPNDQTPHAPLSEKAAGKQRASGESPTSSAKSDEKKNVLDMTSHEAFPQLGSGTAGGASRQMGTAWGSKKSSTGPRINGNSSAAVNGSNTHGSTTSSRASTPASSGMATPNSSAATANGQSSHSQLQRGLGPQTVSIPGRHSERITLLPREMKPRAQLKKPVPDVLREINRHSKANVQMAPGAGGAMHFDARGPVDAVRQALKDVAKELGSKQSISVPVPASVRPYIIGRQGTTIQAISQRTGARIQVPKPEESAPADDDDETMIDVLIEGDSVAAAMARREIEIIANERTSQIHLKMKDIPAELYPFLAGPHNRHASALEEGKDLRVHIPVYHTWVDQPTPPQAQTAPGLLHLGPTAGMPITISGDRRAAEATRAELERRAQILRRQLTMSQLELNKGQHQFVLGDKGSSPHDFLSETGCAVVLPPATHDTETLTIIGPPDKVEDGINKVIDLATSMQMTNVDIAKQHPNAPGGPSAHARNLTRYLQHRREIDRLEQLYNAHIALPTAAHGSMAWEIYSREAKNMIRARTEIINIVNGHPPTRLGQVQVDPFYHQHLRMHATPTVQSDHGVRLVFPTQDDDGMVLLVYEGPEGSHASYETPRKPPTAEEVREFQRALRQAEEYLLGSVDTTREIVSQAVSVPRKFHEKLRKFLAREREALPPGELPVQVQIGEGKSRAGQPLPSHTPASADSEVILRGPAESVAALEQKIAEFVRDEEQYERERGFTLKFAFPAKFSNHLIGKKGENIRKYRDEFDVEIQVQDGQVEIKGPQVKAEAAKARILALGKRLEDEATHTLKIHPRYHKDLIGAKGSQVHRLQDRYNVRIQFPRTSPAKDDHSVADSVSEAGGAHPSGRPTQEQDEVVVKGPRKGADEAREELLSLLQWTIDNSHAATVSVAQNQVPMLIGQGGREMEKIRMTTGAQVDIPDAKRDASGMTPGGRVGIKLRGTKKQVDEAKQLLEERAKVFDDTITKTLEVDRKHHRSLIGSGGTNLREMVIKAGGPDDRRELSRMVRFPGQDSDSNTIRVEGHRDVVEKIVAAIEEQVSRRENETTETVNVPAEKHRMLIGRGGDTRRKLEGQFHVGLDIPRVAENGPAREGVKISGRSEDVARAKEHILKMIESGQGETIQVPRRLHHAVANNGQFFRRLRQDLDVMVDHAGHQPPPRPAIINPRSATGPDGGDMPLITDDESRPDAFRWHVRDNQDESAGEGDIPWVLRGQAESVARARQQLESALKAAQKPVATGYLVLADPRTYRLVIGPGGSQVNSIRDATGCKINIPRNQNHGEAIEIHGEKDRVEEAKEMIVEIVQEGSKGGRNS